MTTPQTFSPNIRILPKGLPVAEGAEPSETPLAELLLADFPRVRDHYAERDVLGALENVPVIITIAARAGWHALAQDISDATESGRLLLADWWRQAWTETFQRPAFWVAPEAAPDPAAHPYPAPAPEAAAEDGESWLDKLADASRRAAEAKFGPMPHAPATAAPDAPAETGKTPGPPGSDQGVNETAEPAPVAEPEPAAAEPATDATAVLLSIAEKQEAAKEPDDATKVIAVADAHTELLPAADAKEGGESDE